MGLFTRLRNGCIYDQLTRNLLITSRYNSKSYNFDIISKVSQFPIGPIQYTLSQRTSWTFQGGYHFPSTYKTLNFGAFCSKGWNQLLCETFGAHLIQAELSFITKQDGTTETVTVVPTSMNNSITT